MLNKDESPEKEWYSKDWFWTIVPNVSETRYIYITSTGDAPLPPSCHCGGKVESSGIAAYLVLSTALLAASSSLFIAE